MELHEYIATLVVGIAFILFSIVVWILCRHHKAINQLNKTLLKLGNTDRIAINVRDINIYVRIIAYIALVFCLGVVIHYLAIALPRIYEEKPLQNLGVDYLGLIVAIFAIIVTLLVTWNIYSTIKAKEELRLTREEIEKRFEERIKELDVCCKQGRNKLDELERKHNELEKDADKRIRNLRANVLRFLAITWSASLLNRSKTELFRRMLSSCVSSVDEYLQNAEIDKANLVISYMMDDVSKIKEEVHLTHTAKEALIDKFTKIHNYTELDKAEDFIELILSISES